MRPVFESTFTQGNHWARSVPGRLSRRTGVEKVVPPSVLFWKMMSAPSWLSLFA